jgi:hypothetical protein
MKGILLGADGDLEVINGTLKFGDTTLQEVGLLLSLNQGELKTDPILGPNLVEKIRSNASRMSLQTIIKKHLKRDNKDFDEVKDYLQILGK